MSFLRIFVKFNHKIKLKLFFKIKLKSQILRSYLEIMMIFLKKYKQTQVFNAYMTIKTHIEYLKPKC